ncbi:N-acetylneuraminate synthase family protein [Streptomyces sp. NBC_00654]|uniref:N-acetylneuraminate synthase family protein n=1 Tax=Streptomyces sp. NBC_00654 TaxID=2975799 RepID=UPI0022553806|nr:N-acetylneuraminate synthase family protein [Streptomyces sp. NBC_00654]MCX4967309.1 N-acetylneuraminate synthase family protein [Streptomyces sp. NBC_00654]
MRALTVNDRTISDETDAYVIAEIGHNHEGDLGKAEELVRQAAAAGASAVKLQKRNNRSLYTRAMYDSPYTGRNSFGPTYGAHREFLEFGTHEYTYLQQLSAELRVDFLATAFDFASVDFLAELGVPAIKIASGDIRNTPLLAYAAKAGKPLIVSTGGADMEAVRRACGTVLPINPDLALLQCTAMYPAEPEELNLAVLSTYRAEFPRTVVGFSGHDLGPWAAWTAYALGARVVEKHVTLDRTRPGSDHKFSLEQADMAEMVDGLRRVRRSLGSRDKQVLPGERPAINKMGKKLVAHRDLPAGHRLIMEDVAIKSPGDGLTPDRLADVVGRHLGRPLAADADITLEDLVDGDADRD